MKTDPVTISLGGHQLSVSPNAAHALVSAGFAAPAHGENYGDALAAGGPVITPACSSRPFRGSAPAGTAIADVVDPFHATGGTRFEIEGDAPPQLALSGKTVIVGDAPGTPGERYAITIRATSPDGRTATGTSTFTAE